MSHKCLKGTIPVRFDLLYFLCISGTWGYRLHLVIIQYFLIW